MAEKSNWRLVCYRQPSNYIVFKVNLTGKTMHWMIKSHRWTYVNFPICLYPRLSYNLQQLACHMAVSTVESQSGWVCSWDEENSKQLIK